MLLVTVAGQQPRNHFHFLVHNGTQFTGLSNLQVPGERRVDFAAMAQAAGYAKSMKFSDQQAFQDAIAGILAGVGPTMIELVIEPEASTFTAENPQKDWANLQFTRMGDEARRLSAWLRTRQAP